LIEIGLDVLNPIQPASMDPAKVKEAFGDKLCFWGTIDEQHTLPFGSPEDVRKEVELRQKTVGKDGGLIIGPTHHVQLDTPLENFWAMANAITEKNLSSILKKATKPANKQPIKEIGQKRSIANRSVRAES